MMILYTLSDHVLRLRGLPDCGRCFLLSLLVGVIDPASCILSAWMIIISVSGHLWLAVDYWIFGCTLRPLVLHVALLHSAVIRRPQLTLRLAPSGFLIQSDLDRQRFGFLAPCKPLPESLIRQCLALSPFSEVLNLGVDFIFVCSVV